MDERKVNICRAAYGPGPDNKRCKDCALLLEIGYHNKNYYKCSLRKHKMGKATDHKANFPTCAKFQQLTAPREIIFVR